LKLSGVSLVAGRPGASSGEVLEAANRIVVACGEGAVAIGNLQAEGRKPLPAADFVRGERVTPGETWGG
jgi:methionyl-tRNA formyltransferase